MTTSAIGICNMALAHVGAGSISDLKEGSREATCAGLFYDQALSATLADFSWPFATRRSALAQKTENGSNFAYCYGLPFDCLQVQDILRRSEQDDPIAFQTGNQEDERVLYADHPNAILVYTAHVTDPSLFSPGFALALSMRLASLIALPLTQNMDIAGRANQLYQNALIMAQSNAAREACKKPRRLAEWTAKRVGGLS